MPVLSLATFSIPERIVLVETPQGERGAEPESDFQYPRTDRIG